MSTASPQRRCHTWHRVARAMLTWVALAAASASLPAADIDSARAVVGRLNEALLGVMRDADTLGYGGRHAQLEPVIRGSFDVRYITRLVLGKAWGGLDSTQRDALVDRFWALTLANYAARFDGYSGETISILESKAMRRERVVVRTELRPPNDDAVALDYVLHDVDGSYLIVNVIADGVSDLSLKRAEVKAVLRDQGYAALLGKLDKQVHSLAGQGG